MWGGGRAGGLREPSPTAGASSDRFVRLKEGGGSLRAVSNRRASATMTGQEVLQIPSESRSKLYVEKSHIIRPSGPAPDPGPLSFVSHASRQEWVSSPQVFLELRTPTSFTEAISSLWSPNERGGPAHEQCLARTSLQELEVARLRRDLCVRTRRLPVENWRPRHGLEH